MIVVLDSGIWISAFQFGGTPQAALDSVFSDHTVAICDQITYIVKRTSSGAEETIASGLTSTWFTDQTAGNGATYEYTVSSVNSNGESRPSPAMAVSLPNPPMPVSAFPPGAARDLTMKVCSGCHSPGLAAKQHLSPQEWRELVRFMAAQGAVATDNQLNQITTYLAKSFPRQAESDQRKEEQ